MQRTWRRRAVPVGEVLLALAREIGMEGRLQEIEILRAWPRAVGPATAAHARPARLQGGTLLVHVTDSAWLHRLSMARRDLVRELNDHLGSPVVKSVRLRIGPVGDPTARALPTRPPTADRRPSAVEDPAIDRALAPVKDLPFGEVVQRILRRQAGLAARR